MRLQLPTIIFLCLSLVVIVPLIYYMKTSDQIVNREAINLEGEEFKSLREQAAVARNAKRHTQAIQSLDEALKMRPDNAEVHNDMGATYYEFGLDQAGPSWPSWKGDLAGKTAAAALKELQTAIDTTVSGYIVLKSDKLSVTEAIEAKVQDSDAYMYIEQFGSNATINIVIGATKEFFMKARDHYLRAIDIRPAYPRPYFNLGALYMKIGQYDTAIDYLEKAFELDPRDEELQQYLNQLR
ncbi:MAG: tetratricopeptide repeat protein [Candidatus Poribacteria bacterium]|nr:tetratricopeptide repeat protein [Candidatus Poribacteria bacterium]